MTLKEMSDKRAAGAPTNYTAIVKDKKKCKDWCIDDTKCVAVMYTPSHACYIYYSKPSLTSATGDTVFMKVKDTTSGMLTDGLTDWEELFVLTFMLGCVIAYKST